MRASQLGADQGRTLEVAQSAVAGTTGSIAGWLLRAAELHPDSGISWLSSAGNELILQTYPDLLQQARALLGGLRACGAGPGARIALLLERAEDFIPAFWACVLGGCLPCPLVPIRNDGLRWARHLAHVNSLLERPLLVTTGALVHEVAGLDVVDLRQLRTGAPAQPWDGVRPEDPALLVLTSGSTGDSKAVVLTHANLFAAMSSKARKQELTARDVTLNWVSFDHVAALLELHLLPLYVGARQLHVMSGDVLTDPLMFLQLIHRARVSMTFAPNFLFGQINAALRSSPRGVPLALDLSCVRRIISGGEAVVVATARQLLEQLVPCGLARGALWPAFGMTETCAGSVYSREFPDADSQRELASLGKPIAGLKMRIVSEAGAVLPPGGVGELQLRGPMVFGGYYNDEEATRAAFTADGWFRTGDLGRIDKGRLSLVGRAKDSIIVNGVNYFSRELETALEELPGVERGFVAAFPFRPKAADTEQLVIAFTPALGHEEAPMLEKLMIAVRNTTVLLWGFRAALILSLPREAFPKTSLGKIQRGLLRQRLEAGELARYVARVRPPSTSVMVAPRGEAERAVAEVFGEIFGQAVSVTASFFDLGGTSLEILKLKQALERRFALGELPLVAMLQNPTVRALTALVSGAAAPAARAYDPLVALQPTGSKTPLFCVHPGSGEVLVFVNLASYFANDRPFYALRARGLGPRESCFTTLKEMVRCYTAAIRRRQPRGPYALAGYSFGAPVAFEIARLLEQQGERVAFLGSIDGDAAIGDPQARLDAIDCAVILAFFLSFIDRQQLHTLPGQLRNACPAEGVHAHLLRIAPPHRVAELDVDVARFKAWAQISHALVQLGETYVPAGKVESVTVFYAEPLRGTKQGWLRQLKRWDQHTRSPNRYIEVGGEHHTLFDFNHVAGLHAVLRAQVDRALGGR